MAHYFVWYRLNEMPSGDPRGAMSAFRVAIEAVLADVRNSTGVDATLLVRSDGSEQPPRNDRGGLTAGSNGVATWMEVYEHVADPVMFERELAAAVLRHDIARFVPEGGRHVEAFVAPE
jgi:hypothetical protein